MLLNSEATFINSQGFFRNKCSNIYYIMFNYDNFTCLLVFLNFDVCSQVVVVVRSRWMKAAQDRSSFHSMGEA